MSTARVVVSSDRSLLTVTRDLWDDLADHGLAVVHHGFAELPGGALDSNRAEVVLELDGEHDIRAVETVVEAWRFEHIAEGATGVLEHIPGDSDVDQSDITSAG